MKLKNNCQTKIKNCKTKMNNLMPNLKIFMKWREINSNKEFRTKEINIRKKCNNKAKNFSNKKDKIKLNMMKNQKMLNKILENKYYIYINIYIIIK